ncbi:fumarylacetoacetate hydrolase family protein [Collimonas sp. OK412]|jgi:2-keto-4-pentenoate hydratase/2-oxohepta-3-ene-1,7-dioic acid hydratase in catechol pathway|uniref:fumarylacetoacetate hydrolase family protein n=1 Tax=Collimonas sp. (strain OK412) TaxID=1801619 RepID=UPI0008F21534|nr:fumarylacetoacetate hydrolase family protein [Collimonas sp. OK412]SFC89431.1 2-keto-4-pentenoate hydratase/2-oxohepta-3-ene-1,7-dioic acid hydratase (catechol pathway) [Collimonas sp. OK412]
MKLLRVGPKGQEKPAMLDAGGKLRDLSGVIADITPQQLTPAGLAKLRGLDPASLPEIAAPGRIGTPFTGVGKFMCVGLNYSDHAAESGLPVPPEPVLFNKWSSCISGPDDAIVMPKNSVKTDWEVELGVVIGSKARYVALDQALSHVAGYCVINDVSEREYQIERSGTWDKGKGCDTFGPVGPWLVTADEVADPQNLSMWLEVNGKRFQDGSTKTMIFNVAFLVHYISQFATLYPGDIISTGTPPGVGMGQKPPLYLKPGDVVRLGIDGLGEQRQTVSAWDESLLD